MFVSALASQNSHCVYYSGEIYMEISRCLLRNKTKPKNTLNTKFGDLNVKTLGASQLVFLNL